MSCADSDVMDHRRTLARHVDSTLTPEEQETGIQFFGDADRFEIITYRPTMVRSLLRHAHADIEWLYVMDGDERGGRVDNPSELAPGDEGFSIEGICASLPLGALTVKGSLRQSNRHSQIVNTPADARAVAEAFAADGGSGND